MSSKWDSTGIAFQSKTWAALSEHLLPGAFIFVFGSSRGWHRLACAIEDAGFVFHPSIMIWGALQGQGFPKATRIDLAVDKAAGVEREVVGTWKPKGTARPAKGSKGHHGKMTTGSMAPIDYDDVELDITAPATDLARAWEGHRYGRQALKPAVEMIICAQKPYEGRPVDSIVETGAGSLWIDGARVGYQGGNDWQSAHGGDTPSHCQIWGKANDAHCQSDSIKPAGRWPPNFCLIHTPPSLCAACAACAADDCDGCGGTGLVGGCRRVGTKRVKGTGIAVKRNLPSSGALQSIDYKARTQRGDDTTYADADGYEETEAWDCVEECAARRIGEQSGERKSGAITAGQPAGQGFHNCLGRQDRPRAPQPRSISASAGTAARFFPQFGWEAEVAERLANSDQVFYASKASRGEREAGLEHLPLESSLTEQVAEVRNQDRYSMSLFCKKCGRRNDYGCDCNAGWEQHPQPGLQRKVRNPHPCIKNISLCRWLATLLLPPPEYAPRRILIPFSGVSSEMIAASLAGWDFVHGIEMSEEYCAIGEARLKFWSQFNSYEEAMDAARSVQQAQRKQEAQAQSGQLKLSL